MTICNNALQMVKVSKRISSLTQNTREANAFNDIFEEKRDQLLEMHAWNFAMKRQQLARESSDPVFGWQYQYALPNDLIRVVGVWDNSDERGRIAYRNEEGYIRTDASQVWIKYVYRVTNPQLMTPLFRQALARLLAANVAVALTHSATLANTMQELFEGTDLPMAKSADSLQDQADDLPESGWVTARYGDDADWQTDPAEP